MNRKATIILLCFSCLVRAAETPPIETTLLDADAIGGCRKVTADGSIIGSFTKVTGEANDKMTAGCVCFFRIKTEPASNP